MGRGREQLDHAAKRTLRTEDGAAVRGAAHGAEAVGKVAGEDVRHLVHVAFEVGDKDIAGDDGVGDGLGDFRLAAAGDGARFVADGAFGHGADQAPEGAAARSGLEVHAVSTGAHVGLAGEQLDLSLGAVGTGPGHGLVAQAEVRLLGHEHDPFELRIKGVSFGLEDEPGWIPRHHIRDAVVFGFAESFEFDAQVVAGKHEGAAGVLLLGRTVEVGGVADLGLHLFFAVAVVVVGDEGDHHSAGVAGADFERGAAVVELVLGFPTHAVAALPGRGQIPVRQSEEGLGQTGQVGGEDDAAGVTRPAVDIQGGVVFRQVRVAGIAKDRFDEIEIGNE